MDEHHTEFDFSQVTEHVFVGTNLCCHHKPHIQQLLDMDISAEIDLDDVRQEPPPEIKIYLWLPVPDNTAPTPSQITSGVALIKALVERGERVYVHCRYGHGRSPTLVAAYLIAGGSDAKSAMATVMAARPEVHFEDSQIAALKRFAADLQ